MKVEINSETSFSVKVLIHIIFICSFIFPTNYFDTLGYPITKYFFIASISFFYLLLIRKVTYKEILFMSGVFILAISTRNIEVFHFISIVTLYKLIKYKETLKQVLLKTRIVWLSLIATLLYIFIYFREDNRWIHTSIKEVNMSGLALFCLALIVMKKNILLGRLTFIVGIFSLSRNYLLALVILIIMNIDIIKSKIVTKRLIKNTTFFKMFIISSFILITLAFYYEYLYLQGDLSNYELGFRRFINLKDFSNYFRFTANKYVFSIMFEYPKFLLSGIPYDDFYKLSAQIAVSTGQVYRNTNAHNFFFSYLRIYGLYSIFVFSYISKILYKIVNKNNYGIYLSFLMYALFLGVGFNMYWLYLLVFVLILYEEDTSFIKQAY